RPAFLQWRWRACDAPGSGCRFSRDRNSSSTVPPARRASSRDSIRLSRVRLRFDEPVGFLEKSEKLRLFCHRGTAGIVQSRRMDTQLIHETASQTFAGTILFPDVVGALLRADVEYY